MSENKVTQEQVDNIFNNSVCEVFHSFDKTVVASCKLSNGFVIVESSSCVDPVNFEETIGMNICTERIKNKIWELEGYKLQSELHDAKQPDPKNGLKTFGQAVASLKRGLKVKRKDWGGYWFLSANPIVTQDKGNEYVQSYSFLNGLIVAVLKDNGGCAPATPYQDDILAEDWVVVD